MTRTRSGALWSLGVVGALCYCIVAAMIPWIRGASMRRACQSQMNEIHLAASEWARYEGRCPTNLLFLKDYSFSTQSLICPRDRERERLPLLDWTHWDADVNSSYELVALPSQNSVTNSAYLKCKVHGFVRCLCRGKQLGSPIRGGRQEATPALLPTNSPSHFAPAPAE